MKKKVVLITGSSSGIGRAAAYRFAQAGFAVVLTYNRGRNRCEAAEKRCKRTGAADTLAVHLDVTDNRSVINAARMVKKKYGAIDFLVNNAGVGVFKPLREQTVRDIERQLRTNLEGLIKMTRSFLPLVRTGIINIASAAGKEPYGELSVYCASKFGVRGFTQSLALENSRLKICCVNPDMTSTRLSGFRGRPPEDVAEVVFRAATGEAKCDREGDVDVWKVIK